MKVRSGNTVNAAGANYSVLPFPSFSNQSMGHFHYFCTTTVIWTEEGINMGF